MSSTFYTDVVTLMSPLQYLKKIKKHPTLIWQSMKINRENIELVTYASTSRTSKTLWINLKLDILPWTYTSFEKKDKRQPARQFLKGSGLLFKDSWWQVRLLPYLHLWPGVALELALTPARTYGLGQDQPLLPMVSAPCLPQLVPSVTTSRS